MKQRYLDLMEQAVDAYTDEHIASYTREVRENGLREHGYPRLTANIGILLAHGRHPERRDIFADMMELCCREILVARARTDAAGNDFSVKEIVFCIEEVEKAGLFDRTVTDGWRNILAQIDPYAVYTCIAAHPPERISNWAAFGAASEQTRLAAGIGNERDFIENQVLSQILSFDENGMYRDPNEPMVYDFVTRLQLAVCLTEGYDGAGKDELEEAFDRSALPTLLMQSVSGEIPFGGRSNQFLHNETFYAALCEWYAVRYAQRGNTELAGQFRSAARLAADSLSRWLTAEEVHHIKNRYPPDSRMGCEGYGYFDKYMVTMGSWAYLAYRWANLLPADDSIPEVPCPAQTGGYVWETGEHFHKMFASCGGYFLEFEKNADPHYDACGLGRIHRRGVPGELCLTVPFAVHPNYTIGENNPRALSLCSSLERNGVRQYGADVPYRTSFTEASPEKVTVTLENELGLTETYEITENGISIRVHGGAGTAYELPVFAFDGAEFTEIAVSENRRELTVTHRGFRCRYTTDGMFEDVGETVRNRNGEYRHYRVSGTGDTVCVSVMLERLNFCK